MKAFKKILSLVLIACMLVSVLSFTSCNKDKDKDNGNTTTDSGNDTTNDISYTITVVDGLNNPVEGVKIAAMYTGGSAQVTTNAEGKAIIKTSATDVKVMITSSPDGYEHTSTISSFKTGSTELKLSVTKIADSKVTYKVKVVDQNGDVVVGAGVQLCYKGICLAAINTGANGEMTNQLDAGYEVSVLISSVPEGYTIPATEASGYHATIAAGQTEITVTVTKN